MGNFGTLSKSTIMEISINSGLMERNSKNKNRLGNRVGWY